MSSSESRLGPALSRELESILKDGCHCDDWNCDSQTFQMLATKSIERINTLVELAQMRVELAERLGNGEYELFRQLAEGAPELLRGHWAVLHDMVRADPRSWVCPDVTVGQIEDGTAELFVPYLDQAALAADWHKMLAHAVQVAAVQDSARGLGLTAQLAGPQPGRT